MSRIFRSPITATTVSDTMCTDARDRFGTPLERRFTRNEIRLMMEAAGLHDIHFSERAPLVCGWFQRMTRLLGLALYGPKAASTRYRLGQYVPGLAQHGIDLQIHHLLGDDYLRRRFSGDSISWTNLLHAGWSRLGSLWGRDEFDAAILHCELLPLMPGWVERILLPKPYIYDFDDAFYLKYRSGKLRIMRPFLGEKFDTVIAGAAAVTAGNNILVEYARRLNANTHFLPTVVNTERYMPAPRPHNDILTIGWIIFFFIFLKA